MESPDRGIGIEAKNFIAASRNTDQATFKLLKNAVLMPGRRARPSRLEPEKRSNNRFCATLRISSRIFFVGGDSRCGSKERVASGLFFAQNQRSVRNNRDKLSLGSQVPPFHHPPAANATSHVPQIS